MSNPKQVRDSHGRFKVDHHIRNTAFAATAVVGLAAAGIAVAFRFGLLDRFLPALGGDSAEDLLIDDHAREWGEYRPAPDGRAAEAFRPHLDLQGTTARDDGPLSGKARRALVDAGEDELA